MNRAEIIDLFQYGGAVAIILSISILLRSLAEILKVMVAQTKD
jgi:hypothetical protein